MQRLSGLLKTEAMRLARNKTKKAIKARGGKLSWVEAWEITECAKQLLAADKSIIRQARRNLKKVKTVRYVRED